MPSRRPPTGPAAAAPPGLFVDSSAWIALRSLRDQHHAKADRLFRDALSRRIPLFTTSLVIAETHRLTLFRAGVQPARRLLELIDASPSVTTDAVSFAVMQATGCGHVLAFDQDFAAAGFTLWR